jgi:hypothetical protein
MTEITLLLYPANQILGGLKQEFEAVLKNANFPDELKFKIEEREPVYIPTTFEVKLLCGSVRELLGEEGLKNFSSLTIEQLRTVYECFTFNFCPYTFENIFSETLMSLNRMTIPVFLLPFPPRMDAVGYVYERNHSLCIFLWFKPHLSLSFPTFVHELYHALALLFTQDFQHCQDKNCAFYRESKVTRICENCKKRLAEAIQKVSPAGGG